MRRTLVLAALLGLPFAARADVSIVSRHAARTHVVGDARAYALVGRKAALSLKSRGEGEVILVLRQVLTRKMQPGRSPTRVRVALDGRQVKTLVLRQPRDGRWAGRRRGRPSAVRELRVPVGAGTHRITVRVTTRGRLVAVATRFEAAPGDDVSLVPLAPLAEGDAGDDAMADVPLADLTGGAASADGEVDDIPLATLTPEAGDSDAPAVDDLPLATLTPEDGRDYEKTPPTGGGELGDIPLAALTPEDGKGPEKTPPEGDDLGEIPLATLTPADGAPSEGATSSTSGETGALALADGGRDVEIERIEAHGETGGLVGRPLHPPRSARAPWAPGRFVLGLRAVGGTHGIGGGTLGGGADVFARLGPERRGLLGLSIDLLPYRLRLVGLGAGPSYGADVRVVPVMATAGWTLGRGDVQWQATAGLGLVVAGLAFDGGPSGTGLMPGAAASVGVLYRVGPGALQLTARVSGGWGRIEASGATHERAVLAEGPFGGLGAGLGYQLEL